MAGKSVKRASRRVACVIDHLSKNTLADIVLDRIKIQAGEDASDEMIISCLQEWLEPIAYLRGDRIPNLKALAERVDRSDAEWKRLKELTSTKPDPEANRDDIPDEMRG